MVPIRHLRTSRRIKAAPGYPNRPSGLVGLIILCLMAAIPADAYAGELRYSVVLPIDRESAFDMWLEPETARRFIAFDVNIEPRVGGLYEAIFEPETDRVGAYAGTYTSRIRTLDRPRQLVFEWNYLTPKQAARQFEGQRMHQESLVEVTFEKHPDGCTTVLIRHHDIPDHAHGAASLEFYRENGWPWIIGRLTALFEPETGAHCRG